MRTITVNIQSLTRETLHGNVLNGFFSTNACINFTHYGKISCKRLYLRCFSITFISLLFDATTVRNVTLQEIRVMETGNDLTASPAQTSVLRRSNRHLRWRKRPASKATKYAAAKVPVIWILNLDAW